MTEIAALCVFAFLAGLVDAVAGGGGLIQVPALFAIFPSVAPPFLLGTNKFSALTGTSIATLRYCWSVPIQWRSLLPAAVIAGIGAILGAKTVTIANPAILRPFFLLLLSGVAVYTLARPKFGDRPQSSVPKQGGAAFITLAAGFGFYDGFFGPGAGSVLMFALVRWFGYDFLGAAATTKVLNLTTNFGALVLFMSTGNVLYSVALPMAVLNVAGGLLGAHFAIRKGSRFIRKAFVIVLVALLGKILIDTVKSF